MSWIGSIALQHATLSLKTRGGRSGCVGDALCNLKPSVQTGLRCNLQQSFKYIIELEQILLGGPDYRSLN